MKHGADPEKWSKETNRAKINTTHNVNGIVFNENNHMVGINVYGSYTLLGTYEHGYMIPADEVKMEYNKIKVINSDVVKKD